MNAVIIDDERFCVEVLSDLLKKHCPEIQVVAQFNDPVQGAE
jgi:hypothetical protein